MQLDELLARGLLDGNGPPTLRVYGWDPSAISVGYNQSMEEFDVHKLERAGVDIVRRPTGGRAIFHAHELTYSVILTIENRTLREIYRMINEALLCGLSVLGISAQLVRASDTSRLMYQEPFSIPCFATSAKSEIQVDGRKLLGSAQRRYGEVVLQHGSLLLGPQHQKLMEFLSEGPNDRLAELLNARAIDVETILGRSVAFEEAAAAVKTGFEQRLDIIFSACQTYEPESGLATEPLRIQ